MSTLLAILSSPQDNDMVRRHWKYFKMTGWPILGCGTTDGKCEWPDPVMRLDTGKMGKMQTPAGSAIFGLLEQELDVWKFCFDHPEYDSVCVVEADNLFVRMPPKEHGGGGYRVTHLPNRSRNGLFRTAYYFSTPRWCDRDTAGLLYTYGSAMLQRGETEHFMSDRFPALICALHDIGVDYEPNWSPSTDAWTDDRWLAEARAAIKGGAWCLHSVKHQWQLDALKDLLPC